MRRNRVFLLGLALLSFAVSASAQEPNTPDPQIDFKVSMPQPHTHLLEVEMRIRQVPGNSVNLVMPVWTPGSYLIREFERHVQDFAASNAAGQSLAWSKINKNTWRVDTLAASDWKATYRVYANEFSVRTNELNQDHAWWTNAALLMYPQGSLKVSSTLHVVAPQSWQVATALPPVPGQQNTFDADNFDVLYDSPVEAGTFKTITFEVRRVPHRIVIHGEGNYDPEKVRTDVKKIVETQIEMMGGEIPYRDYTFFLHLRTNASNGLEHANSSSLSYPRFGFTPDGSTTAAPGVRTYGAFLSLISHEFFHAWNVKRIRPDALGPFDYTRENYTKLLWVAEGITDYYGRLALRQADLISEQSFLRDLAASFQKLQRRHGRMLESVEEASFDAWIKYYRQDENSINSQVDYYDKGAILGVLLDLEIRKRSRGSKALDDVIRHLYREFYKRDRNYTPEDFQKACELMAGSSLEQFFASFVRGREELDYNSALAAAGLRLETASPADLARLSSQAYLGADLVQDQDRLMVTRVYANSPAYIQGLNTGDQIVAVDNMRANRDFLNARLAEKRPGNQINLTVFRFEDLRTLLIKLGQSHEGTYRIVALPNPGSQQKLIFQSWLRVRP